jgi:hypothetical protein
VSLCVFSKCRQPAQYQDVDVSIGSETFGDVSFTKGIVELNSIMQEMIWTH